MRINFRNILYNCCRNIFRRVLRNASETVIAFTRWALQQHATTAALLIAIVASILTRGARPCTRVSMQFVWEMKGMVALGDTCTIGIKLTIAVLHWSTETSVR